MDNELLERLHGYLKPIATILYALFIIVTLAVDAAEKRLKNS